MSKLYWILVIVLVGGGIVGIPIFYELAQTYVSEEAYEKRALKLAKKAEDKEKQEITNALARYAKRKQFEEHQRQQKINKVNEECGPVETFVLNKQWQRLEVCTRDFVKTTWNVEGDGQYLAKIDNKQAHAYNHKQNFYLEGKVLQFKHHSGPPVKLHIHYLPSAGYYAWKYPGPNVKRLERPKYFIKQLVGTWVNSQQEFTIDESGIMTIRWHYGEESVRIARFEGDYFIEIFVKKKSGNSDWEVYETPTKWYADKEGYYKFKVYQLTNDLFEYDPLWDESKRHIMARRVK